MGSASQQVQQGFNPPAGGVPQLCLASLNLGEGAQSTVKEVIGGETLKSDASVPETHFFLQLSGFSPHGRNNLLTSEAEPTAFGIIQL